MYVEFGTSTHAIAGFGAPGKPFQQSVAEIAECGYGHFMLLTWEGGPPIDSSGHSPQSLINLLESDTTAILRVVSSHGLRISAIYPGFGLFDLTAQGVPKTIEKLKRYRDIAWSLGCSLMIHPAGTGEEPGTRFEEKIERIDALAKIMDAIASDTPGSVFRMAADVHFNSTLQMVVDCEYFLANSRIRNTGLCLNTGHLATSKEEGWRLLEKFPERVHVIAWKDHLLEENLPHPVVSVELGKGKTPFNRYIEAYRKVMCPAIQLITFEDVPMEEKKEALRRSREHMLTLYGNK
jgi:sugar phosphate isomerase/epimerase